MEEKLNVFIEQRQSGGCPKDAGGPHMVRGAAVGNH